MRDFGEKMGDFGEKIGSFKRIPAHLFKKKKKKKSQFSDPLKPPPKHPQYPPNLIFKHTNLSQMLPRIFSN
jgi:hypothetical protein